MMSLPIPLNFNLDQKWKKGVGEFGGSEEWRLSPRYSGKCVEPYLQYRSISTGDKRWSTRGVWYNTEVEHNHVVICVFTIETAQFEIYILDYYLPYTIYHLELLFMGLHSCISQLAPYERIVN